MLLRKYGWTGRKMMLLGMFFLVLGALSLRYLPRLMRTDSADAVTGLFYGLAIGCLVVSLVMNRHRPPEDRPAA